MQYFHIEVQQVSKLQYVSVHNYAFPLSINGQDVSLDCQNVALTQRPETENGAYLTMKNMLKWVEENMSHAKTNITEFGWNAQNSQCNAIGESSQSAYTLRAFLLAARYNIHKSFLYHFVDKNEFPLYCTTGLYEGNIQNNNPRKTFESIDKLRSSNLSDKRFLKALEEDSNEANNGNNGEFYYLFGDNAGKPTHIVAWKPVELQYENTAYPAVASNFSTLQLPGNLEVEQGANYWYMACLLYTSPSPRDATLSRMPSSA